MSDAYNAKQRVENALEALRLGLGPYVTTRMERHHGAEWRRFVSRAGGGGQGPELDSYGLLKTILDWYREVFRFDDKLRKARSYISLALDARNAVAHFSGEMQKREALRYLDAVREILVAVGAEAQVSIVDNIYKEQDRAGGELDDQVAEGGGVLGEPPPPGKLRPWREVVQPHPDVLGARFSEAEFAADLAQVDSGRGPDEYTDPNAFFRITYLTEGLTRVLRTAAERFTAQGGSPVIGLQTNFGGGKTHTMLALYHLAGAARAGYSATDLAGVGKIVEAADAGGLGEVQRAVFVGTHKGPSEIMHAGNGREIRTPWGYIAWCLGGWAAVDQIAESEINWTNPGSERLVGVMEASSPCLVLLDEVVAFAKQLTGERYEAFHTFIHSLTEAAKAVPGALIVGSLPESGMEVGDERGWNALQRLELLFGRVQSPWTPASGLETFEIVRRRLFQPLDEDGEKACEQTVRAFSKFYRDNADEFPSEVKDAAYRDQMRRAYPIHPEILKRFSEDWSTIEKFQRTRGILRIMANAVYALWRGESSAPLIILSLLPLSDDRLRTTVLEPLDHSYVPIFQAEVDGELALPKKVEAERRRFGSAMAATRATRAVFLTTAPHRGSSQGRLTGPSLRLACAQPGDQLSIFGDALRVMVERSAFLYAERDVYWFATQPTLNRVAAERSRDVSDEAADTEIISVLRARRQVGQSGFHRIHAAPDSLLDVDDVRAVALVMLPPSDPHQVGSADRTPAQRAVVEVLQRRGAGQRRYRNAVVFVAPDENGLGTCRDIARKHLAWRSILEDTELRKGLTEAQVEDAGSRAMQAAAGLTQRICATWSHVFWPIAAADDNQSGLAVGFALEHMGVGNRAPGRPIAEIVYQKLIDGGIVVGELGPDTLMAELGKVWEETEPHVAVATLADWFASYVYFPRLRDETTLVLALEKLIARIDSPFAFAESYDEVTGKYCGVSLLATDLGDKIVHGLLVRRTALAPLEPDRSDKPKPQEPDVKTSAPPRRFHGSIELNPDRAGVEVAEIAKNILFELGRPKGVTVNVTLEIQAYAPDGFPQDVVDVVQENVRDSRRGLTGIGFENE